MEPISEAQLEVERFVGLLIEEYERLPRRSGGEINAMDFHYVLTDSLNRYRDKAVARDY